MPGPGMELIGDEAEVGEGVVVIGPAVIGAGCRVGEGAMIAQSVVLPSTQLPSGAVARQRVVTPADASNGTIGACLTPPRSMAISRTSSARSCAVVGVSCRRLPRMGFSAAATPFVVSISSWTRFGLYFSSVRTTD